MVENDLPTEVAATVNPPPALNTLNSVSKKIQIRTKSKILGVVREQYLRNDIPCRSELCFENCQKNSTSSEKVNLLPSDTLHYVVPLTDVLSKYLDILESPVFKGLIFAQTVVNVIQQKRLKDYRRICAYVRDSSKGSVFFPNEFFTETYLYRQTNESMTSWTTRMVHKTGAWFYQHLGGQKPVVFISEDPNILEQLTTLSNSFNPEMLQVLSLEEYLGLYSTDPGLIQIYESMSTSTDGEIDNNTVDYKDYYKSDMLEAGLKSGKMVAGTINVNKYLSSTEAYVTQSKGGRGGGGGDKFSGSDVLVLGNINRNRAVHGDRVVVEILPRSEWRAKTTALVKTEEEKDGGDKEKGQDEREWKKDTDDIMPTGQIVGILERNWRRYIATVPSIDATSMERSTGRRVLVYPFDRRIPKIRVQTSQLKKLQGQRVVVQIDNWQVNSSFPQGHIVKSLGKIGDLETEIDSILVENSIEVTPFSEGILSELPGIETVNDWRPDTPAETDRRDLRDILIMSIDPKGCEDVDDAISIRRLASNGNIELGVHIADVTHFVPVNSLTDLEARKRATTVYLADRRYDMLPRVLSAHLCSLLGSVERYAMSVIWEIHPTTFKVKDVWYGKSIIKSSYKLCYEDAQDIVDGASVDEMKEKVQELADFSDNSVLSEKFSELKTTLELLTEVTSHWQRNREAAGALNLESTEVQFEFKESGLDSVKPKAHLAIHETVAECMIMANHWVARKISQEFPLYSILRLHPAPKQENFDELVKCAQSKGWTITTKSNKDLASSLDNCVDQNDPAVNFLLRSLATYAMVQAEYFSTGSVSQENWNHYGLALDKYTHFTSPIRRYADVIVHRLLMAAVTKADWWDGKNKREESLFSNTQLKELCEHINDRNRAAQQTQRMSSQLFQTLYFKDLSLADERCIVDGVIYSLRANGFLVHIPAYGLKGPVYLENKEREVIFNSRNGLVWQNGAVTQSEYKVKVQTVDGTDVYTLFDHVTLGIQLKGSEVHGYQLTFTLLEKGPLVERNAEGKNKQYKSNSSKEKAFNFYSATKERLSQEEDGSEAGCSDEYSVDSKSKVYRFFQDMKLKATVITEQDDN